jgi:hypothetical protein
VLFVIFVTALDDANIDSPFERSCGPADPL